MTEASATSRMLEAAARIGLPLDPELSCVDTIDANTFRLTATIDAIPKTREERTLSISALHSTLLEDFSHMGTIDVRVFAAEACDGDCMPHTPRIASHTIDKWNTCVQNFTTTMILQFAASSYQCVVDTYPWVLADHMRARIPHAIQQTFTNMSMGRSDPFLTHRCMDFILPPLDITATPREQRIVFDDVTRVLHSVPTSTLQIYETLYLCKTCNVPVADVTTDVIRRVFRT